MKMIMCWILVIVIGGLLRYWTRRHGSPNNAGWNNHTAERKKESVRRKNERKWERLTR